MRYIIKIWKQINNVNDETYSNRITDPHLSAAQTQVKGANGPKGWSRTERLTQRLLSYGKLFPSVTVSYWFKTFDKACTVKPWLLDNSSIVHFRCFH